MKKKLIPILLVLCLLVGYSPIVEAKTTANGWIVTDAKHSLIRMNKSCHFLTIKNHKKKAVAKKGRKYRIYYLRYDKNRLYYATKGKQWLKASWTRGKVRYSESKSNSMIISTSKKGRISYQLQSPVKTKKMILKRNAYIYNSTGLLNHGTVKVVPKGTHVKVYSLHKIRGHNFYFTNHGWLKTANFSKK